RARYASPGATIDEARPTSRHGSLAGVAMPAHCRRDPCASHRAGRHDARYRHGSLAARQCRRIAGAGYASHAPVGTTMAASHRLARIAATPSRVALATPRPVRRSTRHARPPGTARWRAWRCLRIADATAAPRTVPVGMMPDPGTARSRHGNAVALPVPATPRARRIGAHDTDAPARSHRGHAVACRARYASAGATIDGARPASRHGSLAGVAMPAHRPRDRCASHRAGRLDARSRHGSLAARQCRRIAGAGYASRAPSCRDPFSQLRPMRSVRDRSFGSEGESE
ncbi:hypothetical protein J2Y58_003537, partial [Sphingomonas sp. BE138]|uniref:hypothetical protein n=1 Tax=Sphingomonas sp. BE138 TaxID=2817845 RepID=UPI00285A7461